MASKKFKVHINLFGNQIINTLLEKLSSVPAVVEARLFYLTSSKKAMLSNGTSYDALATETYVANFLGGEVQDLVPGDFTLVGENYECEISHELDTVTPNIDLYIDNEMLMPGNYEIKEITSTGFKIVAPLDTITKCKIRK